MKLQFRTIAGKWYSDEFDSSLTILEVKEKVAENMGTSSDKMRLIYNSKILANDKTIDELDIEDGKTIIVHIQNAPINQKKPAEQVSAPKQNKEENSKPAEPAKKVEEKPAAEAPKPAENGTISTKPEATPLPIIQEKTQLIDPPNFEEMVAELAAMGFDPMDCRKALRAAVYNPNRAGDFLLNNYIPDLPHLYDPNEDEGNIYDAEEEYDDEEDGERTQEEMEREAMTMFLRQLTKHPEFLQDYLDDLATNNPAVAPFIRSDPAGFLVSIGLNPKDFDLSKLKTNKSDYETFMERFSESEQQAIHRLEKHGFDTMTIIQVFDACGRDETLTAECLEGMK